MRHMWAFTLVELIVVITVLAILGTIAFISLVHNNADARNAIRISDTKVLARSIGIKVNAQQIWALTDFIDTSLPINTFATGSVFSGETLSSYTYSVGSPNPTLFGLHNFTDPVSNNKYPIALIRGELGTFYQVGATLESGMAVVHGNYYSIEENDLEGIIKSHSGTWAVINGQNISLPYQITP